MPSKRKFHKTVIEITVLSEEPIGSVTLHDLAHETMEGSWVGKMENKSIEKISGKEMADELYKADSEPGFFMLDDDGNDEDE